MLPELAISKFAYEKEIYIDWQMSMKIQNK